MPIWYGPEVAQSHFAFTAISVVLCIGVSTFCARPFYLKPCSRDGPFLVSFFVGAGLPFPSLFCCCFKSFSLSLLSHLFQFTVSLFCLLCVRFPLGRRVYPFRSPGVRHTFWPMAESLGDEFILQVCTCGVRVGRWTFLENRPKCDHLPE